MNILHLCGFLGADPEERHTPNGQKLWELRLATRSYKNGQEDTIWWRVTVWGDQFDNLLRHFKKGKPIYIIAEMSKLSTYTDKNGQAQVSYEATARSIHFLPVGDRQEGEQTQNSSGYKTQQQHSFGAGASKAPFGGNNSYGAPQQRDFNPSHSDPNAGAPMQGFGARDNAQFAM